jgi:hypothetical protein
MHTAKAETSQQRRITTAVIIRPGCEICKLSLLAPTAALAAAAAAAAAAAVRINRCPAVAELLCIKLAPTRAAASYTTGICCIHLCG